MNEEVNDPNDRQMDNAQRVAYLIAGYIRHTLTDKERDELDEWVLAEENNMRLFAELTDEKNIETGLRERKLYNADKAVEGLRKKLLSKRQPNVSRKISLRLLMAASLLFFIVLAFFFYKYTRHPGKPGIVINEKPDLLPGGDKAILTLVNGRKIVLDSAKGNILQQGDLKVINLNGKISYIGKSTEMDYHILSTPKGGQYKIILSDGTAVWLNAASSLKYPVTFTGSERKVELTGEGYFEVAKDATKKFIVNANNKGEVEVLGTHFNVNAYDDEESIKTTLVEGSVKLSDLTTHDSRLMKPGEQVALSDGHLTTTPDIDIQEVVAWKNGLFEFKDETIESIMRQVARWYDVTVKYEGKINYHFNASIERKVPVSKLFHLLELNENVHFTIQEKTIIVKP